MPRTARIAEDRIRSASHDYGYIKNVNGKSVMCYKRMTKLLERRFPPKNVEKAVAKLDVWIERIEAGLILPKKKTIEVLDPRKVLVVNGIVTELPVMEDLQSQFKLFLEFKRPAVVQSTWENYAYSYSLFFPEPLPLDADLIELTLLQRYQDLLKRVSDGTMMPRTLLNSVVRINSLFLWLCKRRKLEYNPVESLSRFKVPDPERLVYNRYELELLFAWFKRDRLDWLAEEFRQMSQHPRPDAPWWDPAKESPVLGAIERRRNSFRVKHFARAYEQCWLLYQLLSLSAMRVSEAAALTTQSIVDNTIHIMGKGHRPRLFPLYDTTGDPIIPGLPEIIHTLLDKAQQKHRERLFDWTTNGRPTGASNAWASVRDCMGMSNNRTLHNLRHTARDWWEQELGIDPILGCDLSGHSPAVYLKHYRPDAQLSSLRKRAAEQRKSHKTARL